MPPIVLNVFPAWRRGARLRPSGHVLRHVVDSSEIFSSTGGDVRKSYGFTEQPRHVAEHCASSIALPPHTTTYVALQQFWAPADRAQPVPLRLRVAPNPHNIAYEEELLLTGAARLCVPLYNPNAYTVELATNETPLVCLELPDAVELRVLDSVEEAGETMQFERWSAPDMLTTMRDSCSVLLDAEPARLAELLERAAARQAFAGGRSAGARPEFTEPLYTRDGRPVPPT